MSMQSGNMFRRSRRSKLTLDMAPLIDVVFQLLIFFMVSSSFITPKLDLELPRADSGETTPSPSNLVVSVDESGRIFINQNETSMADFSSNLRKQLEALPEKRVDFQVDHRRSFGEFVELMALARDAGAVRTPIFHKKKK